MKKRSGFQVMLRLVGLVRPLAGFMALAILLGLVGHLCAAFLTVLGGYALAGALGLEIPFSLGLLFGGVLVFAVARGAAEHPFLRHRGFDVPHLLPAGPGHPRGVPRGAAAGPVKKDLPGGRPFCVYRRPSAHRYSFITVSMWRYSSPGSCRSRWSSWSSSRSVTRPVSR